MKNNNDLNKYKKTNISKENKVVTSVNLTAAQFQFLKEENLALGQIVRDRLDEIMEQFNKRKK